MERNICDMYGNVCFEKSMKNITVEETCDCPMECSYISYSFSVVSTPFDANKLCPGSNGKADFLMKEFYENPFPPKFIRKLIQIIVSISILSMVELAFWLIRYVVKRGQKN